MNSEKCNVLVVDDNIQDFRLLSIMIRSQSDASYEFNWAKDSGEAKDALSKQDIDLVAVDYKLGRENGVEVIDELNSMYPDIPYVMITGLEDPDLYKAGMKAGASNFLLKCHESGKLFDRTAQIAIEYNNIQNKLRKAVASQKRITSVLSDDLNKPLASLVGYLAKEIANVDNASRSDLIEILNTAYATASGSFNASKRLFSLGLSEKVISNN